MNNEIENLLPKRYLEAYRLAERKQTIEEIRLRVNGPIMFYGKSGEIYTGENILVKKEDIEEAMEYIFGYSMYAYENQIKEGFVTIRGGHRVGVAGKIVMDGDNIKNITNISSINIRISHEVYGAGEKLAPYIFEKKISNVLIISPPMAGKTTLLRDLIRIGSDTYKLKISVIDERGELGAVYMGEPCNNIGIRSDVFDNAPKDRGIMMSIRAMSPQIIAVDEIGQAADVKALLEAFNCGVKVFATIHGTGLEDISKKDRFSHIIKEGYFDRFIILSKNTDGTREIQLCDKNGSVIKY